MDEIECRVTWKGKKAKMELRSEDDGVKGYVNGTTHVLTLEIDEDDELAEAFCHDDLEYDEDDVSEKALSILEEEEDEDEDDEEDGDDEDDEDDDEEDDDDVEVDEDEDADYGKAIESAGIAGVPTLHAVMVAYGSGIGVDADIRIMRNMFDTLQKKKILNVRETLLTGAEATAQGTLDAVNALEASSNDVIWFFYSGHGCMEEGDRLLCTHGKMVRRAAVVDAVKSKAARFSVVLSDCCAVEEGRLSPEEKLGAATPPSAERLRKLFCGFSGLFDVSSSADYQYSFGGVFTPALIEKSVLGGTEVSWAGVFERTQRLAMATSDGALPPEAKKKLKKLGKEVETHQKPVAFALPQEIG